MHSSFGYRRRDPSRPVRDKRILHYKNGANRWHSESICDNMLSMFGSRQILGARLRALCAVIALLLGSISVPVVLAGGSPDVCAMACCIEEGHCCCNPGRPYVKGQAPGDGPVFTDTQLQTTCPEGCANSTVQFKLLMRVELRAASVITISGSPEFYSDQPAGEHISIDLDSVSPRGPPLHMILS